MSKEVNKKETFQQRLKKAKSIQDFIDIANKHLNISPEAKAAVSKIIEDVKKERGGNLFDKGTVKK